jgi:hypothetical protein
MKTLHDFSWFYQKLLLHLKGFPKAVNKQVSKAIVVDNLSQIFKVQSAWAFETTFMWLLAAYVNPIMTPKATFEILFNT